MPKLPTYDLMARGGGTGPTTPDFINLSTPWANEVSRIGEVITNRSAALVDQFDQTKAMDAFNTYREQARGVLTDLTKKEGLDAQGIQGQYDEWSKKTRDQIVKSNLDAPIQQTYFDKIMDQRTQADLDHLAQHETNQLIKSQKVSFDGYTSQGIKDARVNSSNPQRVNQIVSDWETEIDTKFPGSRSGSSTRTVIGLKSSGITSLLTPR